jgi:hypothetical protein
VRNANIELGEKRKPTTFSSLFESHCANNLTIPRQETNLSAALNDAFARIVDRMFNRARSCEKRKTHGDFGSTNLPSRVKWLDFNYLRSHWLIANANARRGAPVATFAVKVDFQRDRLSRSTIRGLAPTPATMASDAVSESSWPLQSAGEGKEAQARG